MTVKGHRDINALHKMTADAGRINKKLLFKILKTNKDTEYGRKYHFSEIKTVEDFRRLVPVTTYTDYEPYVKRMIENEETNLLTSLPLVGYAQSSGTAGGRKFVPLTQPEVNVYTKYTVTRMLALADDYSKKRGNGHLRPGRGVFTCPSFDDYLPNGMLCSNIADVAAKQLGFLYPYILVVPFTKLFAPEEADFRYVNMRFALEDKHCMYMFSVFLKAYTDVLRYLENNWEIIVDDIEKGTISDISRATPEAREMLASAIKPNPVRAAELRREFSKGFDDTIIKRIWPDMAVVCGIGTSTFEPFSVIGKRYSKDVPFDYSIYGASEGLFAAVDELESPKQLMLIDSCFYEFVPVEDESRILCLNELEAGREYEIVITNQAGLYRYKCGDVIKVVGYMNQCPYVQFSHRKGQLLNLTGEKTTEEHMRVVVEKLAEEAGCAINNWCTCYCLDNHPYHYVLLAENKQGVDLSRYSEFADKVLRETNIRYMHFTDNNEIGKIEIRNQEPGTQRAWADMQVERGVPVSQVKPVRMLDTPQKEKFFLSRVIE